MKLKMVFRVRPGKISAGTTLVDDKPRADMFWPAWFFTMALFLIMFGSIFGGVLIALQMPVFLTVPLLLLLPMGIIMLICWKNQTIRMLSDDSFAYTTLLGKKTVYRFSDITGVKKNGDSMTLFAGDGKVHMESGVIVTERLAERIDQRLKEIAEGEQ